MSGHLEGAKVCPLTTFGNYDKLRWKLVPHCLTLANVLKLHTALSFVPDRLKIKRKKVKPLLDIDINIDLI